MQFSHPGLFFFFPPFFFRYILSQQPILLEYKKKISQVILLTHLLNFHFRKYLIMNFKVYETSFFFFFFNFRTQFLHELTDIRIFAFLCFITKSYFKSVDVRRKITKGARRKRIKKISWHQTIKFVYS